MSQHHFHPGQRVRMTAEAQRRWGHCYASTEATVKCVGSGEGWPPEGHLSVLIDGRSVPENWLADWWEPVQTLAAAGPWPWSVAWWEGAAIAHLIVRE